MAHDPRADGLTVAGDHVQHARREDLPGQLGEAQRRQRRLLRRLDDLYVPSRERRADLPDGHHQRVVPGCDPSDDPHRLAADHRGVAAHVLAGRLALEHPRRAREEAQVVRRDGHLVARVRKRLADVLRLQLGQLFGVVLDRGCELEQRLGALARSGLEPLGQRGLRRLDGAVDVGLRPARDLGDRLARGGVQHLHRAALDRVHPFAADEVLVLRNGHAHRNPSRSELQSA